MWRVTVLSIVLSGAAAFPGLADSRFFCSADDKMVSFTVESGFSATPGHRLNHFRGALLLKDASAAPEFRKRVFTSDHLIHEWSYDGEMRLEILDVPEDTPEKYLDLVVISGKRGQDAATFIGTYNLEIMGDKKITAEGKVSCGTK